MPSTPPFKIDLDRRRPPKQGLYHVVIKITYRGYKSHFRTKFSASEEDFTMAKQDEPQSNQIKLLKLKIKAVEMAFRKNKLHII